MTCGNNHAVKIIYALLDKTEKVVQTCFSTKKMLLVLMQLLEEKD